MKQSSFRWLTIAALLALISSPLQAPIVQARTDTTSFQSIFMTPPSEAAASVTPQVSSSVAVDSAGGIHAAVEYTYKNASNTWVYPVYYAYCASSCSQSASWSWVQLGDTGEYGLLGSAEIALNAQGHPRVMWYIDSREATSQPPYEFAVCNSTCTQKSSWTVVDQPLPGYKSHSNYVFYFALDTQGRPRYIYSGGYGPHYVYCNATCTDHTKWNDIAMTDEAAPISIFSMHLAIAPSGLPSVLGYESNANNPLVYMTCVTSPCNSSSKWSGVIPLINLGNDNAEWTLALDSQGRPRAAMYWKDILGYLWSDGDPTDANSWNSYSLALPSGYGREPALALDSQNLPVLAFNFYNSTAKVDGLEIDTCLANCQPTSGNASWQTQVIETSSQLDAIAYIPPVSPCTTSTWSTVGRFPYIALNSSAVPTLIYEAVATQLGSGSCSTIKTAQTSIRLAVPGGSTPPPSSSQHIYLPITRK